MTDEELDAIERSWSHAPFMDAGAAQTQVLALVAEVRRSRAGSPRLPWPSLDAQRAVERKCSCVETAAATHLTPAEWEQDSFCYEHPDMGVVLAALHEAARVGSVSPTNGDLRAFVLGHREMPDDTKVLAPMGWLRGISDYDRVKAERDNLAAKTKATSTP